MARRRRTPKDCNGAPRLDKMPIEDAAAQLGVSVPDLRALLGLGWTLYDPITKTNNELLTPLELAAECGISTRQLRNLEERGLPSVGEGRSKRYPWPLAEAWYRVWRHRVGPHRGLAGTVDYLDPREAMRQMEIASAQWRAFYALTWPDRSVEDLDKDARAQLEHVRGLITAGRRPPLGWGT